MTMLENRVVLITGASRGIGAATARLLAKYGAAVAVNYINNAAAAERVVQDITSGGGRAIAVRADVRFPDRCHEVPLSLHPTEPSMAMDSVPARAGHERRTRATAQYSWRRMGGVPSPSSNRERQ